MNLKCELRFCLFVCLLRVLNSGHVRNGCDFFRSQVTTIYRVRDIKETIAGNEELLQLRWKPETIHDPCDYAAHCSTI